MNYREALSSEGNNIKLDNDTTKVTIEGKVTRISPDVKGGNTNYYLTIDKDINKIFVSTSKTSTELPLTLVGDKVKIDYQNNNSNVVDIIKFDNLSLGPVENKVKENKLKDNN